VVPAYVDTHVHGAVGADFGAPGVDPTPGIEHHARAGSTALVASIATAASPATVVRLRELAPLVRSGALAGLHLEGPWLAPERRGAHDPGLLRAPEPREVDAFLEAGDGTVVMVTLAPELPGALDTIARLVAAGVVAAIGHTDAGSDTVLRAVDAGATVVTHLYNGMPPMHHRAPGPVGVALADPRLTVELIGDGLHSDDVVMDLTLAAASGRVALVSDAMSATGLGDGSYDLAGSAVVVRDGVARLRAGSSLAGSTTPLGGAAARLLRRGRPLGEIVTATSATPARALGLPGRSLRVGDPADLLELSNGVLVGRVMRQGAWLPAPDPAGPGDTR
jgi:N-acetylglucosamine-6-phosphate deacetylase